MTAPPRPDPAVLERTATLSADGVYRYRLTRRWARAGGDVLWVMLNPSTADAELDDQTVRCIVRFSREWGGASLTVVNLFAFRATKPADLLRARDPVGPDNEATLRLELDRHADAIVCAWGDIPRPLILRAPPFLVWAGDADLYCLGTTKHGYPRHPSRLPADAARERYR